MGIYLFAIVAIIFVANASVQDQIKSLKEYSKLDKAGMAFNIILSVAYLFLYFMSTINSMTDGNPNNTQFGGIMGPFTQFSVFAVPLVCIISIALSVTLRKKGNSKTSFFIQFFPIVTFLLN